MKQKIFFKKGTLIILAGLPGAGKSSLRDSAQMVTPVEECWLSMDSIRERLFGLKTEYDAQGRAYGTLNQGENDRVLRIIFNETYDRLSNGQTTILDGTFLKEEYRELFVTMAVELGVPYLLVVLDTPLEQCLEGNRSRFRKVPEEVIANMVLELPSIYKTCIAKRGDVLVEEV